jgi:hypothetical protein
MMTPASSIPLVHLNNQGQGVITCPQCAKISQVCAAAYRDLHASVKVKCSCGHRFSVLFNTRHFYRKDVSFSGIYTPSGGTTKRQMTVVNLSMTGVRFDTLLPHTLQVDDVVQLVFRLDDQQGTEIHNKIIIRRVDGKQIGAEFCDLQEYQRELGFYLRPT